MAWDAEDLRASLGQRAAGFDLDVENELLNMFPPFCDASRVIANDMPLLQAPAVVVDNVGRVLMWHLPGVFTPDRQVSTPTSTPAVPASNPYRSIRPVSFRPRGISSPISRLGHPVPSRRPDGVNLKRFSNPGSSGDPELGL